MSLEVHVPPDTLSIVTSFVPFESITLAVLVPAPLETTKPNLYPVRLAPRLTVCKLELPAPALTIVVLILSPTIVVCAGT